MLPINEILLDMAGVKEGLRERCHYKKANG